MYIFLINYLILGTPCPVNVMMSNKFYLIILSLIFIHFPLSSVLAMPIGTLLYRSSGDNKAYGYNANDLIVGEKGMLSHIYSGHVAIYVGKENGVDYIVEMQPKGAIKVPAKYFINEALGEKLIGAKIPKEATPNQIIKAVSIAKNLAAKNLAYDFDFKSQKGPLNGEWTCVGLTEKIYESANISNPNNLGSLVYDDGNYAVDITPDGYDNVSVYNAKGDCFSDQVEFSKIKKKSDLLIPAPEIIGFNVGKEVAGDRYIFLPYTQFLQSSLKDVPVDIELSSSFVQSDLRGDAPVLGLILKWSLINNPISSIKIAANKISEVASSLKDKIFPNDGVVLAENNDNYNLEVDASISSKTAALVATSTKNSSSRLAGINTETKNDSLLKVEVLKSTSSVSGGVSSDKTVSVKVGTESKNLKAELNTSKTSTLTLSAKNNEKKDDLVQEKVEPTLAPKITISPRTIPRPTISSGANTILSTSTSTTTNNSNNSTNNPEPEEDEEQDEEQEGELEPEPEEEPVALIAKIYSNGNDDWLEIVNVTAYDFDLAEAGYRLEKVKTGTDPTLIMRFGNEADGVYPGGTVIKAYSHYLVVRSTASDFVKNQADAIATKDTFSWTEDTYTLYLGRGSISSDTDTDIVDKVGYGEAKYFEGSAPASSLKPGYALERKVSATSTVASLSNGGLEELWPRLFDSNDNSNDFLLIPYDLSVIAEEELNNSAHDSSNANQALFQNPPGLDSDGLIALWHFDECYGNLAANEFQINNKPPVDLFKSDDWLVGKWGCGAKINNLATSTKGIFNEPLNINQFSLNFYYQNLEDIFSLFVRFYNPESSGRQAYLEMTSDGSTIYGFPGNIGPTTNLPWLNDKTWHQVTIVVDKENNYWAIYLDGEEFYRYDYTGVIPSFEFLEIGSPQNRTVVIDELSFWNRSLSPNEVKNIYLLNQPFNPYVWPEPQKEPKLEHHWSFDENSGYEAQGLSSIDSIDLIPDLWEMEGKKNSAMKISNNLNLITSIRELSVNDISLSLWLRNANNVDTGMATVEFKNGDRNIFAVTPNLTNTAYVFNENGEYILTPGEILAPRDREWHLFTLTYDSYRYLLTMYLDGQKKVEKRIVKLREGEKINTLRVAGNNDNISIDELKLWSGVLTADQVREEYEKN